MSVDVASTYLTHLVECKCILKLFENVEPPVYHKFVVFSTFEEQTGNLITSYARCNNCNAIHKVTEVGTSEVLGESTMSSQLDSIEEIEFEIPDKLANLLKKYECELYVWQSVRHILNHSILWGTPSAYVNIVLEKDPNTFLTLAGKSLFIKGKDSFVVESFDNQ